MHAIDLPSTGQENNFDCKDIKIENHVLFEIFANVQKCSLDAITQMLRCYLSLGVILRVVLRLVCQEANYKFP